MIKNNSKKIIVFSFVFLVSLISIGFASAISWDFGGMYAKGALYTAQCIAVNPATNDCSCPDGYSASHTWGSAPASEFNGDRNLFYCYKEHQQGVNGVYDFGGMFGTTGSGDHCFENPDTNACSCPEYYTEYQITGATNIDYKSYFCYKPYTGNSLFDFGGMIGSGLVNGNLTYPNALTGTLECPANYEKSQVLGFPSTHDVGDYKLFYCYQDHKAPQINISGNCGIGFGGMYTKVHDTNTCKYSNIVTGSCSCPLGDIATKILGSNATTVSCAAGIDNCPGDDDVYFCSNSNAPGKLRFGGTYGYQVSTTGQIFNSEGVATSCGTVIDNNACLPNFATGYCSCPTGYTAKQITGTTNKDMNSFYCYQDASDGKCGQFDFGGMFGFAGMGSAINPNGPFNIPYNNPVTLDTTCPAGYTSILSLSTCDRDEPYYSCIKVNNNICTESWSCSSWGSCSNGNQARTCSDSNNCGTVLNKPVLTQTCDEDDNNHTDTCSQNWNCSEWSSCSGTTQTRTCTDSNSCGNSTGKPIESQTCGASCTESWSCSSWGSCSNGNQARTCSDSNNCGTILNKPVLTQTCGSSSSCTSSGGSVNRDVAQNFTEENILYLGQNSANNSLLYAQSLSSATNNSGFFGISLWLIVALLIIFILAMVVLILRLV